MKPLAIDLYCGLGGWTEGLLAEGYRVVGFDNERHEYGDAKYPEQLVIQDVLTLHGSHFKDATLIVASPPCQFFSYCAMPWSRAKQLAADVRAEPDRLEKELALFNACFRIQREAIEAAGRHIPLVVENVRGAQEWVGHAAWHFGSFYLWGDIPALMPITVRRVTKTAGLVRVRDGASHTCHLTNQAEHDGIKVPMPAGGDSGMNWSDKTRTGQDFTRIAGQQAEGRKLGPSPGKRWEDRPSSVAAHREGTKQSGISGVRANGKGDRWFQDGAAKSKSKSKSRKAASAAIAKIPFVLAQHIARIYKP